MIHFFARHRNTLNEFINSWAPELRPRVRTHAYREMFSPRNWTAGTYIFSDLERLGPWRRRLAIGFCRRLQRLSPKHIVLNQPERHLPRFQFLKVLHERGINQFQPYRLSDLPGVARFPLFIRSEVDHRGPISGLLHTAEDLSRALSRLSLRHRLRWWQLMALEYCDCSDVGGVFRKYSAMNINGRLIPRHVLLSRDWVTKRQDIVSEAAANEEALFCETFPHGDMLREIFHIAGLDYGRIDYGIKDGRIQVWEINSNPVLVPVPGKIDSRRMPVQSASARRIAEAFSELSR